MPERFQLEPTQTRFVVVSTSPHRAAIGMMTMQLLGFHFVRALDTGLDEWLATR